jgi:hypothetical protein
VLQIGPLRYLGTARNAVLTSFFPVHVRVEWWIEKSRERGANQNVQDAEQRSPSDAPLSHCVNNLLGNQEVATLECIH